ncbi:hypothetical protein ASD54_08700 [Rhizobium sp. Root149]|uniref:hypothetical protein n=1 Tax=Rhizobium sp. Root149 TaxID=1736473 RepID=UPI000713E6CA|nr:hypothetical protein [Rhizobium sp. Root149]KQZ50324.1 hypothetical protein ASD54_08700 [Rhizobium sp. Root149]
MADNEHAIIQLRKAIERRLRDGVEGLVSIVPALRADRDFQSNEFPLVVIQIAETVGPVTEGPSRGKAKKRSIVAAIQIAQIGDPDDGEEALAEFQTKVEAVLDSDPPVLRGVKNWFHAQTSPTAGSPQAGVAEKTLTYTCTILTAPGRADIIL